MRRLIPILFILISPMAFAIYTKPEFKAFADSKESRFWKYFVAHVNHIESLERSPDLIKSLNDKLVEYFPGLGIGFTISYVEGAKISQVYITAHGDKSKFPLVRGLVDKAPDPKKYHIIAFAPPTYLADNLSFNGKTIPTNQIEFSSKINQDGNFDLALYFPSKPLKTDSEFEDALQSLLYADLGELECSKLGNIDILSLSQKGATEHTEKLKELYGVMTYKQ